MIIIQQIYDIDDIVISVVKIFNRQIHVCWCSSDRNMQYSSSNFSEDDKSESRIRSEHREKQRKIAINRRIVSLIYVNKKIKSLIHDRLKMNVRMKISFVCSNSFIEKINKTKEFHKKFSFYWAKKFQKEFSFYWSIKQKSLDESFRFTDKSNTYRNIFFKYLSFVYARLQTSRYYLNLLFLNQLKFFFANFIFLSQILKSRYFSLLQYTSRWQN